MTAMRPFTSSRLQQRRGDPSVASPGVAADIDHVVLAGSARDDIALAAYGCYLDGGSVCGNDVEHWLHAERQLLHARDRGGDRQMP